MQKIVHYQHSQVQITNEKRKKNELINKMPTVYKISIETMISSISSTLSDSKEW